MNLNFDASGHKPQSFDVLPSAWYPMILIEGEEKPSKNNPQNTYFAAVFEVIGENYAGRKIFHNFNFNNTNEDAKRIAYDQLAAIMHGVGLLRIQNIQEIFNKPIMGKVKAVAAVMEDDGVTEKYEAKNEIKGFKPVEQGGGNAAAGASGGLPEGFAAGASVTQAQAASQPNAAAAAAQGATASPAAAASIPTVAAAAPTRKLVMTAKANGGTAEQFRAHDPSWTDDLLVQEGYAIWEVVEPPKPSVPSTPSTPSVPSTPAQGAAATESSSAAGATDDDETPPWLQQQG